MRCQRAVCSHRKVKAKGFGKCQLKRDSNGLGLATEGNLQRRDRTILNNEQNFLMPASRKSYQQEHESKSSFHISNKRLKITRLL